MWVFVLCLVALVAIGCLSRAGAVARPRSLPQLGMALFTPGVAIGEASGTVGGTVFSHNRGGMYMRNRVVPVKVVNPFTSAVRDAMAACSKLWGTLTDAQREAWREYAAGHPVVNRLGQRKTLAAHMAFNQINVRLVQAGDSTLTVPPSAGNPAGLATLVVAVDSVANTGTVTFTATPLGAGIKLMVWAALKTSPGAEYVANKWRLITISAAAGVSPLNIYAALVGRFGTLQAGQEIAFRCQTLDSATGLVSGFSTVDCTVV